MGVSIEFKNISKSYYNENIIKNFNLKIENHEFVTVVGSSGSGKSTLLKMINGLVRAEKGSILLNGKDIYSENIYNMRKKIGYVIQNVGLMPHLTIEKNINYVPNLTKRSKQKDSSLAIKLLETVQLDKSILNKYPHELSGGQQQRVGIARALANKPIVLLMDEPFAALDEKTKITLQKEVKNIYEEFKITIFFITHDIKEALALGTKVLLINKGNIEQYGIKDELLNNPKNDYVKDFFKNYNENANIYASK